MITCASSGFSFLHIPKNGGSTIRDQIEDFDDFGNMFSGRKKSEKFGFYDSAHVPLIRLRSDWPTEFDIISKLDLFAIVRNPSDRFHSAMAQRIRQHLHRNPSELAKSEVFNEIEYVLNHLRDHQDFPEYEFVHFCRQVDFIELDGKEFVQNLFLICELSDLISEFSSRLGTNLLRDIKVNKTITFRHDSLASASIKLKNAAKRILPFSVYSLTREYAMKALTVDGAENLRSAINESNELQSFIEDFYRKDLEIFKKLHHKKSQFL